MKVNTSLLKRVDSYEKSGSGTLIIRYDFQTAGKAHYRP
jgi:hypothetical protein